jgi:hypothetical protein
MITVRRIAVVMLTSTLGAMPAACGIDATTGGPGRPATTISSPATNPTAGPPSAGQPSDRRSSQRTAATENEMEVRITIGDQHFTATLDDSPATRDLAAQLPLTLKMTDHGGVEKTGPLPSPLSLDGQPAGADPDVGAVGYYAPGNDLVLYYGDQSYYDGIVVLGRMHSDAAARIAAIAGSVDVLLRS